MSSETTTRSTSKQATSAFGHGPYHLALSDQNSRTLAACHTEIGLPRLTGTVHDAAHDRDADIQIAVALHETLDPVREADQIDFRAAAGRAGHNLDTALPESETL